MSGVRGLEQLLASTASPNTLLRPKFWRMSPARFWRGFSTQFLGPGSADEVGSESLLDIELQTKIRGDFTITILLSHL